MELEQLARCHLQEGRCGPSHPTPPRPQSAPTAPLSTVDAQARSSHLPRAASGRATPSASGTRTKTGSTCSLAVRPPPFAPRTVPRSPRPCSQAPASPVARRRCGPAHSRDVAGSDDDVRLQRIGQRRVLGGAGAVESGRPTTLTSRGQPTRGPAFAQWSRVFHGNRSFHSNPLDVSQSDTTG